MKRGREYVMVGALMSEIGSIEGISAPQACCYY